MRTIYLEEAYIEDVQRIAFGSSYARSWWDFYSSRVVPIANENQVLTSSSIKWRRIN